MAAELDMGSCWIHWMIASYSSPNLIGGSREGNFPKIQDSEVQNPSDFDCTLKITLWEAGGRLPKRVVPRLLKFSHVATTLSQELKLHS